MQNAKYEIELTRLEFGRKVKDGDSHLKCVL